MTKEVYKRLRRHTGYIQWDCDGILWEVCRICKSKTNCSRYVFGACLLPTNKEIVVFINHFLKIAKIISGQLVVLVYCALILIPAHCNSFVCFIRISLIYKLDLATSDQQLEG